MTEPQPPAESSDQSYGWYVVFVLCVAGIVAYIDRQIINLLVDPIKADLALSDTQISLLQGFSFAVLYAVAAIPLGRMADSTHRVRLIVVGMLAWTLAAVLCGLADSFVTLFLARMLVGIGEAVLTPAGFSLLADLFPPARLARPISVFTASSFFGSGVALISGGYLIEVLSTQASVVLPLFGELAVWQAAFVIGALPGLPVAAWFLLSVREPTRRAAVAREDAQRYRQGFAHAARYLRDNASLFLPLFFGLALLAAAQFALGAWVPAFFIRAFGWSASEIGYVQGLLFLGCGAAGVISGGLITDALQARGRADANLRLATLCALAAAPCAVVLPFLASGSAAVIPVALSMFLGTMPFGAGAAIVPMVAPPAFRAQLVALYLLVANLTGLAGGPFLVALLTDRLFADPAAVGRSLGLAVPGLLLVSALLTGLGWAPLRRKLTGLAAPA
ncbi:MAG: MFS transporter [Pseudomonadota bacterium]